MLRLEPEVMLSLIQTAEPTTLGTNPVVKLKISRHATSVAADGPRRGQPGAGIE